MQGLYRGVVRSLAIGAVIGIFTSTGQAGTILKLNPGTVASNIEFNTGVLSTVDDGNAGTTGEQNTAVDFQGFLGAIPDIPPLNASVTLNGISRVGSATVFPFGLMMQNFSGGTVSIYDASNTLLLSGSLNASTLAGAVGPPGTDVLFTTTFNLITGGTLAPQIGPGSVALKMNITEVNGGAGFTVATEGSVLNPFTAEALLTLTGEQPVPEPATALLAAVVTGMTVLGIRRRR
ncbi:MAG TPA: hypothetical protein VHK01_11665 [Lacipirellulaceae bacterium]|nr:hypothetical protein [Lacipirellulaceae bacterium]